jgi:hypothetical protein
VHYVVLEMRARTALALFALLGCGRLPRPVPAIDPNVNFAAHAEHQRIVIDRQLGGGGGLVEPPGGLRWGGGPTFILNQDGQTVADLWLTAPATVQVRNAGSTSAPVTGAVEPSWDDNAIRLTLRPAGETVFRTDPFEREVTGGGPPALSRNAQTILDVRGTYRAVVRDAKGAEAGWMRVKMSPYQVSPRIYDGVLPVEVGPGLAAAITVALSSEIDWIEDHTLDVYRGTSGGPLRQSVPMGR